MKAIFSYKVFLENAYVISMSQTDELKITKFRENLHPNDSCEIRI